MHDALVMFLMLVFGHALADFPLQGDYVAKQKGNNAVVMSMHCIIHAGIVYWITGSLVLFFLEFVLHFLIDNAKIKGQISFNFDQGLHILCKAIYTILLVGLSSSIPAVLN